MMHSANNLNTGSTIVTDPRTSVAKLEQRRWDALVAGDLPELDRLFADDMTYTHSNGMVDTKQTYLDALRDGVFRYVHIAVDDATSHEFGGTVVVTGKAVATSESAHGRLVSPLRYTGVWTEQGGEWRFVAWHSCPVPA
jgi:ketosteroid isomerase-like protein